MTDKNMSPDDIVNHLLDSGQEAMGKAASEDMIDTLMFHMKGLSEVDQLMTVQAMMAMLCIDMAGNREMEAILIRTASHSVCCDMMAKFFEQCPALDGKPAPELTVVN